MPKSAAPPFNHLALRLKLGLSQTEFWGRVSVAQSTASRYEAGFNGNDAISRPIPAPIWTLLTIAYGNARQHTKALEQLIYERK